MLREGEPDVRSCSLEQTLHAINWLLLINGVELFSNTQKDFLFHGLGGICNAITFSNLVKEGPCQGNDQDACQNVLSFRNPKDITITVILPVRSRGYFRIYTYIMTFPDHPLATLGRFEPKFPDGFVNSTLELDFNETLRELRKIIDRHLVSQLEWLVIFLPRTMTAIKKSKTTFPNFLNMLKRKDEDKYVSSFDHRYYDDVVTALLKVFNLKDQWRFVRLDSDEMRTYQCFPSLANKRPNGSIHIATHAKPVEDVAKNAVGTCLLNSHLKAALQNLQRNTRNFHKTDISSAVPLALFSCESCARFDLISIYEAVGIEYASESASPEQNAAANEKLDTKDTTLMSMCNATPMDCRTAFPLTTRHFSQYAQQIVCLKKALGYCLRRKLRRNLDIAMRAVHPMVPSLLICPQRCTANGSAQDSSTSSIEQNNFPPKFAQNRVVILKTGLSHIPTMLRKVARINDPLSPGLANLTTPTNSALQKPPFSALLFNLKSLAKSYVDIGDWTGALKAIDQIEHEFESLILDSQMPSKADGLQCTPLRSASPMTWEEKSIYYKAWRDLSHQRNTQVNQDASRKLVPVPLTRAGVPIRFLCTSFFVPVCTYNSSWDPPLRKDISILDFRWYICAHQCWLLHLTKKRNELLEVALSFAQWLYDVKLPICRTEDIDLDEWHTWFISLVFDIIEFATVTPLSPEYNFPLRMRNTTPIAANNALLFQDDEPDIVTFSSVASSSESPRHSSDMDSHAKEEDRFKNARRQVTIQTFATYSCLTNTNAVNISRKVAGGAVSTMELNDLLQSDSTPVNRIHKVHELHSNDAINPRVPPTGRISTDPTLDYTELHTIPLVDVCIKDSESLDVCSHSLELEPHQHSGSLWKANIRPGYADIISDDCPDFGTSIDSCAQPSTSFSDSAHDRSTKWKELLPVIRSESPLTRKEISRNSPQISRARNLVSSDMSLKSPRSMTFLARFLGDHNSKNIASLMTSPKTGKSPKTSAGSSDLPSPRSAKNGVNATLSYESAKRNLNSSLQSYRPVDLEPIVFQLWMLLLQSLLFQLRALCDGFLPPIASIGGYAQSQDNSSELGPLWGIISSLHSKILMMAASLIPERNEQQGNLIYQECQYPHAISQIPLNEFFLACIIHLTGKEGVRFRDANQSVAFSQFIQVVFYVFDCTIHSAKISGYDRTRLTLEIWRMHWVSKLASAIQLDDDSEKSNIVWKKPWHYRIGIDDSLSRLLNFPFWIHLHRALFETKFISLLGFPRVFVRLIQIVAYQYVKSASIQEAKTFLTEVVKNCKESGIDLHFTACGTDHSQLSSAELESNSATSNPNTAHLLFLEQLLHMFELDSLLIPGQPKPLSFD